MQVGKARQGEEGVSWNPELASVAGVKAVQRVFGQEWLELEWGLWGFDCG